MAFKWPACDAFRAQAQSLRDRCPSENVGMALGNFCGVTRSPINPKALQLPWAGGGPLGRGPGLKSQEAGSELFGGESRH